MPELTHDVPEDGFHEIQLSGKQVVFLFMVTTVVSVMIFLCGVLVGRGVRADRGPESDSAPIAGDPSAPATTPGTGDPASTVAAASGAVPPAEAPVPPTGEDLSYEGRLKGKEKPAAPLKPQESAQPQSAPAAAPPPQPAPVTKTEPIVQSTGPDVPTSGKPGTWVLQVTALGNRGAANAMVRRLIAKGYPAFVFPPAPGTPQIFRVQVGKYSDRQEADQVARRLEKEEQFKPVIKR